MDALESKLRSLGRRLTFRILLVLFSPMLPVPHARGRLRSEVSDAEGKDLGMMGTGRTC